MSDEQFCYWLQGFVELTGGKEPTLDQWKVIKEHLQLVFKKVTVETVKSDELNIDDALLALKGMKVTRSDLIC